MQVLIRIDVIVPQILSVSQTQAERLWGFFVPPPERSIEGGRLGIAKQVRDLADRKRRIREIALGGIFARQVEQLVVRETCRSQTALE
jgi:hypothetical protein